MDNEHCVAIMAAILMGTIGKDQQVKYTFEYAVADAQTILGLALRNERLPYYAKATEWNEVK